MSCFILCFLYVCVEIRMEIFMFYVSKIYGGINGNVFDCKMEKYSGVLLIFG